MTSSNPDLPRAGTRQTENSRQVIITALVAMVTIMMMMKMMNIAMMMIDMYIFEFWAIQLGILLVPGRYRVPRGYIFMPQVVENRLSI